METKNTIDSINAKLAKLNVASFAKNGQGRKSIYKVSEKIQNDEKAMKIFRRNLRRQKTAICLIVVSEFKETKKLSDETMKKFKKFYSENFLVNDYSLASFTSVNEEKESSKLYDIALSIVKIQVTEKK